MQMWHLLVAEAVLVETNPVVEPTTDDTAEEVVAPTPSLIGAGLMLPM